MAHAIHMPPPQPRQTGYTREMTESPGHGAILTIDLDALVANYRLLAARAGKATTGAVVKANAYGLGIEAVVPALLRAGCRTFYVAHLSEAARVRALSADATLYVLNGLPPRSAPAYAALNARPVLGSMAEIDEWRAAGNRPFALHVDTGLNRLGLRVEEALGLDATGLDIAMVLTHFVSSEDASDPVNARQRAAFETACRMFPRTPRGMANSSGFFLEGLPLFEHFRCGYAMYGGNPTPGKPNPMKQVIRLEAPVVQLRPVPAGETVGYNSQWTAKRDSMIAVISVGYADGYPRGASATDTKTGGSGRVSGVIVPFAGRVSMDLIALDVSDLPKGSVTRGTKISLIDEVLDVDRVGAAAGTIGYHVLTSLGHRYHRILIGG